MTPTLPILKPWIIPLMILLLAAGCSKTMPYSRRVAVHDSLFSGYVSVEKIEKINRYSIRITDTARHRSDRIYTPYTVFDFQTGDINHDGKTDICIGIIKPTPFDPVLKKRLFIFQIDRCFIRPLWLSSRLVYPFESFVLAENLQHRVKVLVLETPDDKTYCISEYGWQSFGLTREREIARYSSRFRAKHLLKKLTHSKNLPI